MAVVTSNHLSTIFSCPQHEFELSKVPSLKIKQVAENFITHFSQEQFTLPCWRTLQDQPLLSQEAEKNVKDLFTRDIVKKLQSPDSEQTGFYLVGRGKHNQVWGHSTYPSLVFKLMESQQANKQEQVAKTALEVTRAIDRCWIQIPRAASIELENTTVYVEERLPLELNVESHQEFWARVISHYQSSNSSENFKANLHTLVDQIQHLIERVGFWDVGYHNLPEVRIDGRGVCGTDFENVDPDLKQTNAGLERLVNVFPVKPLSDKVYQAYMLTLPEAVNQSNAQNLELAKAFGLDPFLNTIEQSSQIFEQTLERQKNDLQALQMALHQYDKTGDFLGDTPISEFDFDSLNSSSEKKLAHYFLDAIKEKQEENKDKKMELISKRYISFQPIMIYTEKYSRQEFINVLNALKQQQYIINWTDQYHSQVVPASISLNEVKYINYRIRY